MLTDLIFIHFKNSDESWLAYDEDYEATLNAEDISKNDVIKKTFEEFNADELAQALASELEIYNYHSLVDFPEAFLKKLEDKKE